MSVRGWLEKRKTVFLKEPLVKKIGSSGSPQIDEHKKWQYKSLLERHIPPLLKDWSENAAFYRSRYPPDYEIADFYERLINYLKELQAEYERKMFR